MNIKFLHLNMFSGQYMENIIEYLQKEDFDIMQLQEVEGGTRFGEFKDCFETIKKRLSVQGELSVCMRTTDKKTVAYFGNATFYKNNLTVKDKKIIWLKKYKEVEQWKPRTIQDDARNLLSLLFTINGKAVYFLNTHLAWGPNPYDRKYKLVQAERMIAYIKTLNKPFILSGDFNLTSDSKVVTSLNSLAKNVPMKYGITNTLNPNTHRVKKLFPPGLAVDFIYTTSSIKVNSFSVVSDVDLSDHYGLKAEFEI